MNVTKPYDLVDEGEAGVRRLVEAFYDLMEREPEFAALRAVHAADLRPMRARLADFLTQWTGGPRVWTERHPERGCMVSVHAPFAIDGKLADDWMACMREAFAEAAVPQAFRGMVEPVLTQMCQGLRNDRR
ncbi:MAG TPA: group II truncated hemoglobin [Phenylobacterium sp.]|uniref:group II truncated hemoglobin n=1 Tax=Phenylobacterium sp. TaxID=1871053 RepID=UPI002B4884B4|nr:group II truncated hemoglobin [Phenylobacterium sp.]HKR90452.1 group II truncated hemoglobin [Phenylobacterium sp.]